ncbi:MAG: DUF6356 family protein [Pseudomonadota bacterium]
MRTTLNRLFLSHPASVDETYVQHLAFAAKFAGQLLLAATAALIHAIIPCLCEKTASRMIRDMHQRLEQR